MVTQQTTQPEVFETNTARHSSAWATYFVFVASAGWIGHSLDCLTETWLIAMAVGGVFWWVIGRRFVLGLDKDGAANDLSLPILKQTSDARAIAQAAEQPDASLVLQAAGALVRGQARGVDDNLDPVIEAILASRWAETENLRDAADRFLQIGLAGTCCGIAKLFHGLVISGDAKALADSAGNAVSSMSMALATTVAGIAIGLLLNSQSSAAGQTISKMHAQLRGYLSFLKFRNSN